MINKRVAKAEAILHDHGLAAMIFTDLNNIRYLSGFTGTDGVLILTKDSLSFLTDSRYTTQAREQTECRVIEYKDKLDGISDFLANQPDKGRIGFEGSILTFQVYSSLLEKAGPEFEFVPVKDTTSLRAVKDRDEIGKMRSAADISARALDSILGLLQPGITESEVALELEIAARRLGSERKAFDFIVASGVRGALPHGVASSKRIDRGDVVTIDFGSCFEGYYSDETVNFAIGTISTEMQKIHNIVKKAHDLAIKSIKPGVLLSDIDKIARDFISEKGYGVNFGHGLGHGVGLDVHESPRVSPLATMRAEEGMVFTVEPGIYIPDLGGIRIEDMVVVTAAGCDCLTRLPKELRLLTN
ncbi:MAG: integrase [Desulfuromonas sp.]|nr:MAG: integrase [Desulfuromonas sp.]